MIIYLRIHLIEEVKTIKDLLDIIAPLADANRYTIITELLKRDYCVGGLARKLSITEAAVSQHLKILREAGLITGEKRGYFRHYRVNQELLKTAADQLTQMSSVERDSSAVCPPARKEDCPLCRSGVLEGLN